MGVNVVKIGNTELFNITDTCDADKVLNTAQFYDKNGDKVYGTCDYNCNTSSDTLNDNLGFVRTGYTFHDQAGIQRTGSMPWIDTATTITLGTEMPVAKDPSYYNGITFVRDEAVISSDQIALGSRILGVDGAYAGTEVVQTGKYIQAATDYTGTGDRFNLITPDGDNTAFRNVKVGKIWYNESTTTGTSGKTLSIVSLTET